METQLLCDVTLVSFTQRLQTGETKLLRHPPRPSCSKSCEQPRSTTWVWTCGRRRTSTPSRKSSRFTTRRASSSHRGGGSSRGRNLSLRDVHSSVSWPSSSSSLENKPKKLFVLLILYTNQRIADTADAPLSHHAACNTWPQICGRFAPPPLVSFGVVLFNYQILFYFLFCLHFISVMSSWSADYLLLLDFVFHHLIIINNSTKPTISLRSKLKFPCLQKASPESENQRNLIKFWRTIDFFFSSSLSLLFQCLVLRVLMKCWMST